MIEIDDPLVAPPPIEVPLESAPLVRVIAQLRFPLVIAIEQRSFIAPFQEAIRDKYPVLREEQMQVGIILGKDGITQIQPSIAWRFSDIEGHWRVSLTQGFVALETTAYKSRSDFLARFGEIVVALNEHIGPKLVDRLGLRYIDRISGDAVNDIAQLVRPEVRGIAGTPASTHAQHFLSETMFAIAGAQVLARWGCLPPGATVDPAAIEPIDELSWIIDLDMSSEGAVPFVVDHVVTETQRFAERIYTFFRWAVTPEFLKRYGGKV